MALTVSLTIPPDRVPESPDEAPILPVVYPEAYARIMYVRSMAEDSFIFVCWYADEAARINEEQPVKVLEYPVSTDDLPGNIYPAAYNHLKSLPDFDGAIDC